MATNSQLTLRQMASEIVLANPDYGYELAVRAIQNWYRKTLDKRNWYGTLQNGQVVVPNAYGTGTVALTNGSALVTGTGTAWDSTMGGFQFRAGFTTPIYTIATVDSPTQLTMALPWGGPTTSSAGYSIFKQIVSLGARLKLVLTMVNQNQGYPLSIHVPRQQIDAMDVWRSTTGWTLALVDNYPDANGDPQFELYPSPTSAQSFPFVAYFQPPDLTEDNDKPITWIRSDVLVTGAKSEALMHGGPSAKYYDPTGARAALAMYNAGVAEMMMIDNQLAQRDVRWNFGANGAYGGLFNQSHAMSSDGGSQWPTDY